MAGSFPRFRLYEDDGVTLVYEFDNVLDINDFQDPVKFVEHESLRGQGSIIIEGSDAAWDLNLTFLLIGTDYEDLVDQMQTVQSNIANFTRYILKVDLTNATTKDYNVMRVNTLQWPLDRARKRTRLQTGNITFRVLTWA